MAKFYYTDLATGQRKEISEAAARELQRNAQRAANERRAQQSALKDPPIYGTAASLVGNARPTS